MSEPFVMRQRIEPGGIDRLKERLAERQEMAVAEEEAVLDVWDREGLHTLSLFLEHADGGEYLVWYIEAADVDELVETRLQSTHPLHDLEDEMMAEVLQDPTETGDVEPLFHAVNPARPTSFLADAIE